MGEGTVGVKEGEGRVGESEVEGDIKNNGCLCRVPINNLVSKSREEKVISEGSMSCLGYTVVFTEPCL